MAELSPAAFTWTAAQAAARASSPVADPLKLLGGAMAAGDLAVLAISSSGAYLLRHGVVIPSTGVAAVTLLAAVLSFNVMRMMGCYDKHVLASLAVQIGRAAQGWTTVMVVLLMSAYLTKTSDDFSRFWVVTWYGTALVGIGVVRLVAVAKVNRWRQQGKLSRTVAVVDLVGTGDDLARRLMRNGVGTMRLVGVFGPERTGERKNGVADLIVLARLFRIDEVMVVVSGKRDDAVEAIVRKLGTIPANVRLCPDIPELTLPPREVGMLFGQPVLTVYHRPLMGWNSVAKRTEDLVLCTLGLIVVAPVMLVIAAAIKLDSPGPVLFRQKRPGFNNNVITVYKFRSMTHQHAPDTVVVQARRNDPRVTRVGKFLRRTSLDELPQLINVLQGDMSLVGPRPHAIAHNDEYAALIDDYLGRHRVQPGITGWAQVNGLRGETETLDKMQRRVEHDLAYIDNWSLLLDLRIIFLTVFLTVFDRNAYQSGISLQIALGSEYPMKVALVCDSMSAYGGAERVIEQILALYPEADLFTVLDAVPAGQRSFLGDRPIHSSFLQKLPRVSRYYRKLLHVWPLAVEQLDVMAYDLVISTHHSVAYGVLTRPGQVHVSYVFSPARYAWDLQHEYLREAGLERGIMSMIARHTLHKIRLWDYAAAQRPDAMAACSRFVSDRMWRVHRRQTEVIYPPVPAITRPEGVSRGDYYLSVGRLVPYKRIDLLARAFSAMHGRKLKIVGTGPDMKKVAAACGPNVELLGFRSNDEVRRLMAGARAFLYAGVEDFGITPVEAQALGTPVIAFADGGLRETVVGAPAPHPTGVFFNEQSVPSITEAVDRFERSIGDYTAEACIANAERFSEEAFRTAFQTFVDRAVRAERAGRDRLGLYTPPMSPVSAAAPEAVLP